MKTIPPLSINRAKRGTAPDQKVKTPSSLNILAAHTKLFLYSFLASIDCILSVCQWWHITKHLLTLPGLNNIQRLSDISFTVSLPNHLLVSGNVTYTVMIPARPPMPKVAAVPSFSPGAT